MQSRNSAQRNLVLNIMEGNKSHPTADNIYKEARKADPHISRGTVYRNLNLLVQRGEILRLSIDEGSDRYDGNSSPHYHFKCSKCGNVSDVDIPYISQLNNIADASGEVLSHNIIFTGICKCCCK